MNINQLEYFVTTVRCGSYSLAARELFVAPQTVAKAVNDLERELNVSLCRRSSRSIEPTPFGQVFSTRASEILYRLTELESLAKRQTLSQTEEGVAMLAVAYSPHRGNAISPSDFAPFDRKHPRIRLSRTYRPSGACLAALEEGVVDAAIVAGRTTRPNIVCTRLLSFPLSLAISRNHPLARQDSIDFEDLRGTPIAEPEDLRYCHNVIADRLLAQGVEPIFTAVPPHVTDHRRFLDEKRGAFFVVNDPALAALYPEAVTVPVAPEDPVSIPLCLAYAQNNENRVLPTVESYLINLAARIRKQGR